MEHTVKLIKKNTVKAQLLIPFEMLSYLEHTYPIILAIF